MSDNRQYTKTPQFALVTGATGFTGGHLARQLARRGWRVRALVRGDSDTHSLQNNGIECVQGDLLDRESVVSAANGVHCIFHIAAVYRSAKHPDSYYWDVNVGGTDHVLEAARRCGVVRTIHCSTAGVHGEIHDVPADENAPFNPGDIYQQTKLDGERIAADAFANDLSGVVFRPVGIYGPGDLRFLKLFKTIQSGRFRMFGSGRVLYHLTYIDDLIDGIIRCATHLNAPGKKYLLAGPRYTTIAELVARIASTLNVRCPDGRLPIVPLFAAAAACEFVCRAAGVEPPLHRRRLDFFRKDRAFSIEKARKEIGYEPMIDLQEGLARTAAWYVAKGYLAPISGTRGSTESRYVSTQHAMLHELSQR